MSKIFSFSLYFTSFLPLWISILFIDIKSCIENTDNLWTEIISISCILGFMLICIFVLFVTLCVNTTEGTQKQHLLSAVEEKSITAEYLLSYILPLFAFDFTQWSQVILFLIFFLSLGFLAIKHNYLSVNVLLELTNFRFYTCTVENEDGIVNEKTILSHQR